MKLLARSIAVLIIGSCLGWAAGQSAEAIYKSLVERIRSGDQAVDFDELRKATADAGVESDVEERDKLLAAARKRDFKKMAAAAEAVLQSNYTDLDGHYFASIAASKLGKPEQAEFHHKVGLELLRSIRRTGDGKSPTSAIKVLSVDEEYFVLRMANQTFRSQALGSCDGKPCDVMTTWDPESKQERKWYFDIEIPFKRNLALFGGKENKKEK